MRKIVEKLLHFIWNKKFRLNILASRGFLNHWSDEKYLKYKFKSIFGYELDLEHPHTFNEKLQWLKLHDRNPFYTTLVDKYVVKQYVADKIGAEYVIPTLGVWNSFDEIDFDSLPNQFVLKTTHDSGGVVLVKDKKTFDRKKARTKLTKSLKRDYYYCGREWPYKGVPHRIIAEKFIGDVKEECVTDYKFFCFSGVPKIMYLSKDRATDPRTDFFDMDGKHLPLHMKDPNADIVPSLPPQFEEMKKFAQILCADYPFVRIDFYITHNQIYMGEFTFYHASGFAPVYPKSWGLLLGDWIKISTINK